MRKFVETIVIAGICVLGAADTATAQPEKTLLKCQKTAGKVAGKHAAEVHKTVTKCLSEIAEGRISNLGSGDAAEPCAKAFRKLQNTDDATKQLEDKATAKILKACDPLTNIDLEHVTDDVVDGNNSGGKTVTGDALRGDRLGMACRVGEGTAGTGSSGRLGTIAEWIDCELAAAERGALRQVHLEYPQADFWLRDVRPNIVALTDLTANEEADALAVLDRVRRWVDRGNLTVYDRVTELTWEKKTDDSSIHDKDNFYTWSAGFSAPDGTAFTTFLNTLNGGATGVGSCTSIDGVVQSGGFVGHCDWRLPTIAELQTILLEPYPCSTSPCIDTTIFGPTVSSFYWSSTTGAGFPGNAWDVGFSDGNVDSDFKVFVIYVRAVRGGL